jgi:hypothetical protein
MAGMKNLIRLSIVFLSFAVGGCHGDDPNERNVTWKASSLSPNGHITAEAKTVENSGFGTGSIYTDVYLRQPEQPPIMILGFDYDSSPNLPEIHKVEMTWKSSDQLEVAYRGHATIDFQAIKCCGVAITVHDISDGK